MELSLHSINSWSTLLYEKKNNVAWITLNRPRFLNVYNIQMRDDLFEVMEAIRDDHEVRVVVLRGAGQKSFCAGADLSEFLTASSPIAARRARWARDLWGLFLGIAQPLIAVLDGYVLGSGLEIALCCDLRLAAPTARFGLPESGLGMIPAAGGTQTLPRAVARGHALEMLLTGQWIDGREAFRVGLVNRIIARGKLLQTAESMAEKIASHNPEVIRLAKRAVVEGINLPLAAALKLERKLALHACESSQSR